MLIFRYVVYWIIGILSQLQRYLHSLLGYQLKCRVLSLPFCSISLLIKSWGLSVGFPLQHHLSLDGHPPPNSQNIHKKVRSFKISIVMITVSVCLSEFKILDWTFSSSFWRCKKARVRILACIHMSAFSYWGPKFKSLYYYMDQENWWGEKT